jgi:glycosyltransferase involved in cell wall biosynthesis
MTSSRIASRKRSAKEIASLPLLLGNARRSPTFHPQHAPLVSVVIATYNWSSVLRYAVASALRQTYPNLEVIVVGDACTDDSAAVAGSFDDPRVRWHNLPQNSGCQSVPNNMGIELARGEYIAYHGHDDIWSPTHIAVVMHALLRDRADVGHTVAEVVGPQGSGYRTFSGNTLFRRSPEIRVPPSALAHRKDLIDSIGPWRDHRAIVSTPDDEFVGRARRHGATFASVNALTVFKFSSAQRRNSYVERLSDEQANYYRRSESERGFVYRELAAVGAAQCRGLFVSLTAGLPQRTTPPDPLPPGWYVSENRRIRGLDP